MRLTAFALRNPLAIGLLAVALAIAGLYAYFSMSISVVPNITAPTAIVITNDPAADPVTIETQITRPIEDAIAGLSNIKTLTSTSSQGLSAVTVNFTSNVNADFVTVDVERAVNSARGSLPAVASQPTIAKQDTTSALPVMLVALIGPQPLDQLESVAEDQVQRAFQHVDGVGAVTLSGGPTREIWVEADPLRLQAYGLDFNAVQQALQANQLSQPAGSLVDGGSDVNIRLNALVSDPQALGDIVVSGQGGVASVRLKDVASIVDTHAPTTAIDRYNGAPAVTLSVIRLANANTLSVSRGIRQQIDQLQSSLPPGARLQVVTDLATYTQQSFNTIQQTLIEAVLLTGVILFAFLHTWRSTLIVLLSIPTSVLTTFLLMDLVGLNLNLFSMLALTLSVGILVDDSIVVIENISRHLALGDAPVLAAIAGRNEIAVAAITITLVDVVVYVPIALISGTSGQVIRPFALVIAAATLTSLLVSFSLTPLLASRFLSFEAALERKRGPIAAFALWWDGQFARMEGGYKSLLQGTLRTGLSVSGRGVGMRWLVIALGVASLIGGLGVLRTGRVGVDIFPSGDQSEVDITVVMPPATDIATTDATVQQLESQLRTYPEVNLVYAHTGSSSSPVALASGAGGGGDRAQVTALLVPPGQRRRSAAELANVFRQDLSAAAPGATIRTALPNPFGFGGFGGQAIQVTVEGPDPNTLNDLVAQIGDAIESVSGAVDVNSSNQAVVTQYDLNFDRARAAGVGVSAQAAATDLAAAVSGVKASAYQRPGQSSIGVRVIANDPFRAGVGNLGAVPVLSSSGALVRLNQVGSISRTTTPTQITHDSRQRSITVNASAASGYSVGTVQTAVQQRLKGIVLPPGYTIGYGGQAAQGAQTFGDIFAALGAALLLMYVLMALLFKSLTLPLAVLISLPLAVVGAFGAMGLTATNFTLFSLLGVSLLMGLVGKNAILLVDYTDTLRKRGSSRLEALLEAGPTRLRPILMTTLSVMFALLPVATGFEAGSELLKAAAVVLIGGLLTSTMLTLVFVPAMYTVFDDAQEAVMRIARRDRAPRRLEPVEVAILHGEELASNSPR